MTKDEAKPGALICLIDEPDKWGIVTCLSDDESTVYYSPRGASFFHQSAALCDVRLDHAPADRTWADDPAHWGGPTTE